MRTVVDELTKEYRFWLGFACSHSLELTRDEQVILAAEPTTTQDLMRELMALRLHDDTEPNEIRVDEELESLFRTRRSLLHDILQSTEGETPLDTESDS